MEGGLFGDGDTLAKSVPVPKEIIFIKRRIIMNKIGTITSYGLIFGMIGTFLGGIIGVFIKINSNKFMSFILEFAAGLMTAVICFDLIPQALEISNISGCIIGIIIGIIMMLFCDSIINRLDFQGKKIENKNLFKTGMVIFVGLAVHNFPERNGYWFWI